MRAGLFLCAALLLSACQMQMPFAGTDGPAEAEAAMAETAPQETVAVDASAASERTGLGGFFARLAAPTPADEADSVAADAAELASLSEAFDEASEPAPPRKGLFSFLKPKSEPSPFEGVDVAVVDADVAATASGATGPEDVDNDADVVATAEPARAGLGGFLSFLRPRETAEAAVVEAAAPAPEAFDARPETLGLEPTLPSEPETPAAPRKGLFGGLFAGLPKAGDAGAPATSSTASADQILPFGTVGINCEVNVKRAAKKVDAFPREGRATWTLHDTDPASTTPRTQFITGFADGCARQVTASLVMFGAPGLHEVHRYSAAMKGEPWSKVDKAYEATKVKICGVKKRTTCPADKLSALELQVAFASVYKGFGASGGQLQMLLGEGRLLSDQTLD